MMCNSCNKFEIVSVCDLTHNKCKLCEKCKLNKIVHYKYCSDKPLSGGELEKYKESERQRYKKYYQLNKEKERLRVKKWYDENNKKVECDICGIFVSRLGLSKHKLSQKCQKVKETLN